jgi:hypothetical protein
MGLGFTDRELYATNVFTDNERILLSRWKPEYRDGDYYMPSGTNMFEDMWIPNVLGLEYEDGPVKVEIIPSDNETGLWYVCYDGDFIGEKHLYNWKPLLKKVKYGRNPERFELDVSDVNRPQWCDDMFGLHVWTDNIKMESGDGPLSVTLRRIE